MGRLYRVLGDGIEHYLAFHVEYLHLGARLEAIFFLISAGITICPLDDNLTAGMSSSFTFWSKIKFVCVIVKEVLLNQLLRCHKVCYRHILRHGVICYKIDCI